MDFGIPPYLPCHSQYTLNVFPRFKISISILHLRLFLMVMPCLWHFFASPQKLQTHHMVSCLISSPWPPSLPSPMTSNQYHVRDFGNLPSLGTSLKHSFVTCEAEQFCAGTKITNPRRICFKDVDLLLIVVYSPASIVPIKKGLLF